MKENSFRERFKKSPLFFIKALDIPVITVSIIICVFVFLAAYSRGTETSQVIIRCQGKTWIFPLETEEFFSITGSIGETVITIHQGRAAIVSSPCEGKTCVAAGELQKNGQWAACLPNGIFLLIEGDNKSDDIDIVSF